MADGKVVIETDLDSSGIEKGLSKIERITLTGLKVAAATIGGVSTALGGVAAAAVKVGSDFESQMSRVKAISGATGEEFEKLKNQAIQLGADTAFSSAQAAEGMENLAAAGFETNEIMDAMPGLLDLAAASGEDLANSSDIAASTLRGFGLAASDAGHVADVLAENANRTNSSVAETGEAMKYIAPLARAAGISMEETAAAIGIMANAGIQGSQAGTTLRGALSRLSKPTDDMQQAMNELGVSFYDSEGKMLSLAEQVGMLQSAMEGMTDEQKNNYLVTLYGQEALSGMLALINEGPESLSALTEAYEVCDGSAKKAAETMQDNLRGAVEQLKGSAESLGIVFYESVADNMKDAAVVATDSVNNITDAFNSGGLNEAIRTAGDEFANLSVRAAEHAPGMVDTAVDFIESFANGIIQNRGRLIGAAGEVAESFAGGLAELLPASVQKPVEDTIDAISDSLNSGGLKTAGKTVVKTLDNVIDVVGKLAEVALPPLTKVLDFAGENLDVLASSAAAAFTAFKGYKVVSTASGVLSKATKAWKTASSVVDAYNVVQMACTAQGVISNATLTVGQAAVGLLTRKISLATAAHTAWNAVKAADPMGLLITAVGALAAGIGVYALATKDASEFTGELTEKQKESIAASKEAIESIEQEAEARQKKLAASTAEIDSAQSLWSELNRIVDANGQVKAGYEERAKYITGELADALGIEIGLVDGVVTNYEELESSIYDVIAAKKAKAVLDAMESDYADAMQEQADKAANLADAYEKLSAKEADHTRIEAELAEEAKNASTVMSHTGEEVTVYSDKYYELAEQLKSTENELETLQAEFDSANAAMQDNQKVISDYNMLTEAVMSGSTDKINSALATIQNGIDTTLKVGSDAAIQQANTTADTLVKILQGEQEGLYQLQNQTKESLAESLGMALNQVGTGAEEMKQVLSSAGKEGSAQIVAAMAQAKISGTLSAEAEAGMESFIAGFDGLDAKTQEVWAQAWYGALKGLEGFEELADPAQEGAETFLESLRTALEVHSPSAAVAAIFENVWPGATQGLDSGKEELNNKGNSVVQTFLETIGGTDLMASAQAIGSKIMSFFGLGIDSQKENSRVKGKANADAANSGAGSVNPTDTGSEFGSKYSFGVGSKTAEANKEGTSLAKNAESGASTADGNSIGSDFGAGFVGGIGSWITSAAAKAAELASAAYNAARNWLDEHSPSRKARKIGKFFSQGFALGIEDETRAVQRASENLADISLSSLDMSDVSLRMGELLAVNTGRVTRSFALESNAGIRNPSESEMLMRLSEEDIEKLAYRFGNIAGEKVADSVDGMTMEVNGRVFGRIVGEVENR